MKKCRYCGAELPDNAKACSNCGRLLTDEEGNELTNAGKPAGTGQDSSNQASEPGSAQAGNSAANQQPAEKRSEFPWDNQIPGQSSGSSQTSGGSEDQESVGAAQGQNAAQNNSFAQNSSGGASAGGNGGASSDQGQERGYWQYGKWHPLDDLNRDTGAQNNSRRNAGNTTSANSGQNSWNSGYGQNGNAQQNGWNSGYGQSANNQQGSWNSGYGQNGNAQQNGWNNGYGQNGNNQQNGWNNGYGQNGNNQQNAWNNGYGQSANNQQGSWNSGYGQNANNQQGGWNSGYGQNYQQNNWNGGIRQKKNGFAVASIVFGFLSLILNGFLFFIPSILAIAFGIIALIQIKNNPGQYRGKREAIIGIVAGAAFLVLYIFAFVEAAHLMQDPTFRKELEQYMNKLMK